MCGIVQPIWACFNVITGILADGWCMPLARDNKCIR